MNVSPSSNLPNTRRVLVADDNADAAESLGEVLRLLGHDVRVAYDGQQALNLAADFRPEVVLLDIGMPKMNGYETAQQMRAQPWAAGTTLVALTGWGHDEDKRRASDAGFDRHFTKPVDPVELLQMLET
jgi:CheY-like chemotaxis protein